MRFLEQLRGLLRPRTQVDPARFGDPLALQVDWTPMKSGGANFCTHKLVKRTPERIEFRPALPAILFYALFLLVGVVMLGIGLWLAISERAHAVIAITSATGLVFAAAGGWMLSQGTISAVFDKHFGWFWKCRQDPAEVFDKRELKNFAYLKDIHALQIIGEWCSGGKNSFYSYELNLVLRDGSRLNVTDHGNLLQLRRDAAQLADFLGVPLWDATAG